MNKNIVSTAVALALSSALAACADRVPTNPSAGENAAGQLAPEGAEQPEHLRAVPRYVVDLDASGSLRPGQPVHLTATIDGKLPTRDVEIRILLPEMAAAEQSGWDAVRVTPNAELAPQARSRRSLGRGERTHVSARVTIPEPGYYMALASVVQKSGEPLVEGGTYVQNVIHKEIWLWIDENGGRITDAYDESVFPAGVRHQPGPRSTYDEAPRLRSPRDRGPAGQRTGSDAVALDWTNGTVSYWITYVHKDSARYNELTGQTDNKFPIVAYGSVRIFDSANQLVSSWSGNIDESSYVEFSCYAGGRYELEISFESQTYMSLNPREGGRWTGSFATDCGISTLGLVNANRAHLWRNFQRVIGATHGMGLPRPWIEVDVDGGSGSFYCPGTNFIGCRTSDYIHVSTQPNSNGYEESIWGAYGAFVAGHEYGHAYHQKRLDARLDALYPGCPGHGFGALLSMECAYFEGFANYFALYTIGERAGYITNGVEANAWFPGGDGSRYEDAVAAFLRDVVDLENAYYQPTDDDAVQYPATWVADVVRTCEVYAGGAWRKPTGIDHIVHCMEGQVDSGITTSTNYFPARSPDPTAQRNSAVLPYGYSRAAVRTLWLRNLYKHTSFSPT